MTIRATRKEVFQRHPPANVARPLTVPPVDTSTHTRITGIRPTHDYTQSYDYRNSVFTRRRVGVRLGVRNTQQKHSGTGAAWEQ
jgi:hypothetical protein